MISSRPRRRCLVVATGGRVPTASDVGVDSNTLSSAQWRRRPQLFSSRRRCEVILSPSLWSENPNSPVPSCGDEGSSRVCSVCKPGPFSSKFGSGYLTRTYPTRSWAWTKLAGYRSYKKSLDFSSRSLSITLDF